MTQQELQQLENLFSKRQGEKETLESQLSEVEEQIISSDRALEVCSKVIVVFQKASEYARRQMQSTIEELVTNALQVVFGGDMKFVVELGTRAGAPVAEFYVLDGDLKCSPMDAKGGGLVDVISTALRLAVLELYEPKIEGPILLDEPGKMVSAEYAENFAYFLKEYCHRVGRQLIMVTHNTALAAAGDRTLRVRIDDGASEVVQQ